MNYRGNNLLVSNEVYTYLKVLAEFMSEGTDAKMTEDQVAEGILREAITTKNPELVTLYAEHEQARKDAGNAYRKIEEKMKEAVKL